MVRGGWRPGQEGPFPNMSLVDRTWTQAPAHSDLVYQSDIGLDMRPGTTGPGEAYGTELSHRFSSTRRCF